MPALTAVTTNPTLGAGSTATARYCKVGKLIRAQVLFIFGTSGVGAGSGEYRVSLPVNYGASQVLGILIGSWLFDSSAGSFRTGGARSISGNLVQFNPDSGGNVTHASPWTWAASDQIHLEFSYEID